MTNDRALPGVRGIALTLLVLLPAAAASWAAELRVYQARRLAAGTTQPQPGDLAKLDPMTGFTDGATGKPAEAQTSAAVCYDDERLHLLVTCFEPNVAGLVAKARGKDALVFPDDCVEVFISPTGSQKDYYHFAANALGSRYDEKVKNNSWDADWTAEAHVGTNRWTLQIAIPFSALGGRPSRAAVWCVNVDRQRQAGGKLQLSSWSPTGQDFHRVANFGRLVLADDYAACLATNTITPWQSRTPQLRARAKIDAAAGQKLEERLAAIRQQLEPVAKAAKSGARLRLPAFAQLLSTGEAALKGLDDAEQELHEAVAKIELAQAMRKLAKPGQALLAYSVRAVTNRKILPTPAPPETLDRGLSMRACRGEYEPASFVVYPLDSTLRLEVTATALKGHGATIGADAVDIRAVKRWYQSGEGGRFPINRGMRVLTPELLLKDDDLVKVDYEKKENYVKLSFPDGTRKWLWVSSPKPTPEERNISAAGQPIRDARTLQPVTVPKQTAKQFWLTVHVPKSATAGKYSGAIHVRCAGELLETLRLELEVLPFGLEPNPLESSVYYHWGINLDVTGQGTVRHHSRSVAQYRAELANLLAHGVDNPTLGVRFDTGLLGLALWLRQEVGMKNDHLYYLIAGTGTPPEQIQQIIKIAKQFGYSDVYFYGQDEARGEKLNAQRPVWERVHKAGGKVFVAGSQGHNFPALGDLQDLLVCYGDPSEEEAALWHSKGHKIFCYANPQSGIEEPETYRRNFGLLLAANDYDGGMTYIFYHGWNDFSGRRYRQHNFVYPTVDGVIDTIQWEGYREGIDDLRYLATLRRAIQMASKSNGSKAKLAEQAQAFVDAMDVSGDLYALREKMIAWTLRLSP